MMKNKKKLIIIISSVAALAIAGIAVGVIVGVNNNLSAKYKKALNKLINQDNSEAYRLFNELGNYKDSKLKRAYSYELMHFEQGNKNYEGLIDNVINNKGKVEVVFDTNSGTFIDNKLIDQKMDRYITETAFKSYHDFSKWDLTFAKYNKDQDIISIKIDALYNDHNYSIIYRLNGGSISSETPLHYTYYTSDLAIPAPNKVGYSFLGYKSNIFKEDEPVDNYVIHKGTSGDIELTAFYSPNTYHINLDPNDGTCDTPSMDCVYDADYRNSFPIAQKDYYTFDGWYYGDTLVDITRFNIAMEDATIVAKYTPIEYNINYVLNEGTLLNEAITHINYETPATPIPFATKEGYVFTGWQIEGQNEADIHFKTPEHVHEDLTLVATFAKYEVSSSDPHQFTHLENGNIIKQFVLPAHITSIEGGLKGSLLSNLDTIDVEPGSIFEVKDEFLVLEEDNKTEIHFAPFGRFGTVDTLDIPDGVTHISSHVFEKFQFRQVNAPNSLHYVGEASFKRTYLVNFNGGDLYEIGNEAFNDCEILTDSLLENNEDVTAIGDLAFDHCLAFRSIHLREKLKTVGNKAFADNHFLQTIRFECDALIDIKDNAFQGDDNIENLIAKTVTIDKLLNATKDSRTFIKNIEIIGNGTLENELFKNYTALETMTFTDTDLVTINDSCFENDGKLKAITIPSGVTTISPNAFKNSGVRQATFEDASHLRNIYSGAFSDSRLQSIDLSLAKDLQIEDGAFANCYYLEEVAVQYNAMETFKGAFENCPNIKKISLYLDQTSIQSFDLAERYFSGLTNLEEVEIIYLNKDIIVDPVNIDLPYSFFSGCSSLKDFTLYNCKIDSIGEYTFENCYMFNNTNKNVNHLEVYPRGCFFGCNSLQVDISGATEIGRYAFVSCHNLGEFTIPSTVISVGTEAFAYAYGNISINVDFTKAQIDAMNVEDGNWYNWDMNCFCPINYKN